MEVNYAGFIPISTVDWAGHAVATIFLRGCNLNCAYCQNREYITGENMVDIENIKKQILDAKPFISGVVFSGGEPLMQFYQVLQLAKFARSEGLQVGIHTNGCYPDETRHLVIDDAVDKFFIDIKAPLDDEYLFGRVIGQKDYIRKVMYEVAETIKTANRFGFIELRTTVISGFVDSRWRIAGISSWIYNYLGSDVTYVIQQGNPEHCKHVVDRIEQYRSNNHYKDRVSNPEIAIIPREELIEMANIAKAYLRDVRIRTQERGEERI